MSIATRTGKLGTTFQVKWRNTANDQESESFPSRVYGTVAKARRAAELHDAYVKLHPDYRLEQPAAPVAERRGGPTVADVYADHVAARRVSASRAAADACLFRNQLAPLHKLPVAGLRALRIRQWLTGLQAATKPDGRRKYADRTIRDALALLRGILNTAIDAGIIEASPAASVRVTGREEKKQLGDDDVLSPAEASAVLAAIPPRWRGLFVVMIYGGVRLSEACGLTPDTLDLDAGTITLGVQRTEDVDGARRVRSGGKTRKAWRTVDLPAEAVTALREFLAAYPVAATTDPVEHGCNPYLLFRTESGAIPNRSNLRQRVWNPALKRAGITRHVPMQHTRHSHASWLFRAGYDPVDAAQRLGHSRPSVGLDTYARFLPGDGEDRLAKLNAYLGAS